MARPAKHILVTGAAGKVLAQILSIDCRGRGIFPETKLLALGVIANQIESDPHQLRADAAIPAKLIPGKVSLQEAVLGNRLGCISVRNGERHEPEHLRPVQPDQGVNIFQFGNTVFSRECDELNRDRRLCHH